MFAFRPLANASAAIGTPRCRHPPPGRADAAIIPPGATTKPLCPSTMTSAFCPTAEATTGRPAASSSSSFTEDLLRLTRVSSKG